MSRFKFRAWHPKNKFLGTLTLAQGIEGGPV